MKAEFDDWFLSTFGEPFPLPGEAPTHHVRGMAWVSDPSLADGLTLPLRPELLEHPASFTLSGLWGHGVNSYAFYFVGRWPAHRCFFRLRLGGAYGNPSRDKAEVLRFLKEYSTFRETWMDRLGTSSFAYELRAGVAEATLGEAHVRVEARKADAATWWSLVNQRLEETRGS